MSRKEKDTTTIRVNKEVRDVINELAKDWGVDANTVIIRLLDFFFNAQQIRGASPDSASSSSPVTVSPPASSSSTGETSLLSLPPFDAINETRVVMLHLFEPVFEALKALIQVYPDLRAELGPHITALEERARNAIEAWWQPKPLIATTEETQEALEGGERDAEEG
jgi:hypothetical protein